jgi:hypothetical protein
VIKIIITLLVLVALAIGYFSLKGGGALIDSVTATEVSQLLKQPKDFDGRRVTVRGVVVHSAGIMGVGGYRLEQGGAEVYVISSHGIPQPGIEVTVTGTFKQAFAIGTFQYAVILEK